MHCVAEGKEDVRDPMLTLFCEQSYTMSMMLTQLNVDMDIIGYDKEAQRWKE